MTMELIIIPFKEESMPVLAYHYIDMTIKDKNGHLRMSGLSLANKLRDIGICQCNNNNNPIQKG